MQRLYVDMLDTALRTDRQMAFLMGPRQVGKSTAADMVAARWEHSCEWNWDTTSGRADVLAGSSRIIDVAGLDVDRAEPTLLVFDELHKFSKWKDFLKGLFDATENRARILVTGSARLDIFRRGGDSLMGRYFPWRMHPLSPGELLDPVLPDGVLRPPERIDAEVLECLLRFGGFPEPFTKMTDAFSARWQRTRHAQLFKEDLRDLTRIQDLGQLAQLAEVLRHRSGQLSSYSGLAREVCVSIPTVKSWLQALELFYFSFPVRPWFKNVPRALRKEPKYYLWDWSNVPDAGQRAETFIACMLAKSTQIWTDRGLGEYELHFIRDHQGHEVDFLVTHNGDPWCLIEVKQRSTTLAPALARFQSATGAKHAFQVCLDLEPSGADMFESSRPVVVAARDFLSRLM